MILNKITSYIICVSILVFTGCELIDHLNNTVEEEIVLATPSNFNVVFNEGIVELNWEDTAEGEEIYSIERKTGIDGNYEVIGTVEKNTTTYSDITSRCNSHYYYRIQAKKQNITSDYSNEADIITPEFVETKLQVKWEKTFGNAFADSCYQIQISSKCGYVMAGATNVSDNTVAYNGLVMEVDSKGNILWQRIIGGEYSDAIRSIIKTDDSGYIGCGHINYNPFNNNSGIYPDILIVKFGKNGDIEWQKTMGNTYRDFSFSIEETHNTNGNVDGYIVAGTTSGVTGDFPSGPLNLGGLIIKLDINGEIEWYKRFKNSTDDSIYDVKQTADGGFIICGTEKKGLGNVHNHFLVMKLDPQGSIEWEQSLYGYYGGDQARSVEETADGGFIVAGHISPDPLLNVGHGLLSDMFVVKLDSGGTIIWEKFLGGSNADYCYSIKQTWDGGFILTGKTNSSDFDVSGYHHGTVTLNNGNVYDTWDAWIVKINSQGEIQWQHCLGETEDDVLYDMQQLSNYKFILVGEKNGNRSNNDVNKDIWLVELGL